MTSIFIDRGSRHSQAEIRRRNGGAGWNRTGEKVLPTFALPLGDRAVSNAVPIRRRSLGFRSL